MRAAAVLVAAGKGNRFGGPVPKQFAILAGKPVIRHAAEALLRHVPVVVPVGDAEPIRDALAGLDIRPPVPGGETRQESVYAGLKALAATAPDVVLVHDAARPVNPEATIPALLGALRSHDGAIPGVLVSDTLKRVKSGRVSATVPREGLYRAQTPQAFRYHLLRALHATGGTAATDDASLMEEAGHPVAIVAGSEDNVKITFGEDLVRVEQTLAGSLQARVGTGFDVHAKQDGRALMLCGIAVPHAWGLAGHSDADVGIHALCDAIYGALAEGDIGRHFPPSSEEWRDADSARFLRHAAERIAARGGKLSNADVTLICEAPKIGPHAPAMRARLAELLGVDEGRVSVKATTTERLGFTGRGEGIAAQAVASVLLP
jgi:2-C-methyl-D-erythritol 4-phosphate cytidylyltransferase / 2-C-methyl-D-erythritol 2,4-cyclodiphosphate synthase